MDKDNFEQNGFIVDLGDAKDASEIINQLSNILEMPESQNKKICLKLGNVDLSKSQLLSVKALITSMNSELIMINSTSALTNTSAQSLNIEIAELTNKISIDLYKDAEKSEPEKEEVSEVAEDEESKAEDAEVAVAEAEAAESPDNDSSEEAAEDLEEEVEKIEEAPEVKIETRVVEEELPDEIIETQSEKVESNYELFNPEEEVEFENKIEAENRLSEMFGKQEEVEEEETPEIKERHEMETEISKLPTLYIQETLRSGQTMSYDGNVIIIGDVHPGSEIIAKGDITIWGVLGGIAHAGARGNNYAKIRALKMNAIQLRISGYYARRPDTFNIPYIQRANEFTPEEARVEDEQIAIYKIYD